MLALLQSLGNIVAGRLNAANQFDHNLDFRICQDFFRIGSEKRSRHNCILCIYQDFSPGSFYSNAASQSAFYVCLVLFQHGGKTFAYISETQKPDNYIFQLFHPIIYCFDTCIQLYLPKVSCNASS